MIDWQGLQSGDRVVHATDPNASDTIFAGGSDEKNPGNWGITFSNNGASPATTNVLDTYHAFERAPGAPGFLYLAFNREDTSGTTYLAFELNQDPVPARQSNGFPIPCRTTGDILIAFVVSGSARSVRVERWNTLTHTAPSSEHPLGCALTGDLTPATGLGANVDVQGSFNSAAINNYLPLGEPGLVLTQGTNMIPAGRFAETAINLTAALGALDDGCRVFGSVWAHSRSSDEVNSALKDYVKPEPFHFNSCKVTPTLTSVTSGAINRNARTHRLRRHGVLSRSLTNNDTAVLSGGDNPTGTLTFRLYGPNDATCTGSPADQVPMNVTGNGAYQVPAFTPTAPGIYRWRATYSGDDNNNPAGPTPCGADAETIVITKASPTLTTTASGPLVRNRGVRVHSGRAGGQIFDEATLSGGFNPTGTITFHLYGPGNRRCRGTPIDTSTATVNGEGTYPSLPFAVTRAGTWRWVAIYSGDDNNHGARTACGDPTETIVIAKARPTLMTVASGATVFDNPISDEATLDGGAQPTGTIIFKVYGPDNGECSGPPAHVFRVPVHGNDVYPSGDFTPPAVGTYRWVARYTGDGFNAPAGPTRCDEPAEQQVVAHQVVQPSLSTSVVPGTALAAVGLPIRDFATLSGGSQPPAPAPGGHIIFRVYGPNNTGCNRPAAATSVVKVSGNGTYSSGTFTPSAAGEYRWVAFYTGDALNKRVKTACGDPLETITVTKARPSISTRARASVTLPGFTRDAATLHGVNPGGTIVFELFGPNDPSCSVTPAFHAELNVVGNRVYLSPRFYPQAAGTYRWVVSYSGDANNNPAATGCGDSGEITVVLPHHPSLSTSASPPAHLHASARRVRAAGLSIYDSAKLRGFRPTGEIIFRLYGPNDTTCADPIFTTATVVDGNGIYNSKAFTPEVSGTYRWTATYSGDGNNNPVGPTACDDLAEAVHVTVPAHPSLITSASDAVALGGAVHDTAILSGGSDPTGTITFKLYTPSDAPNAAACSGKPIFTSKVGVHGNGEYTSDSFIPTTAGAYLWLAKYSGDHANHPAATACRDTGETAVVRPPDITPVTPGLSTTVSPSPGLGAPMFDTAHLTGGIDPGGAITFRLFGPDDTTCAAAPVFTAVTAVDGNGDYRSAPFTLLLPGTYRWVASYAGDAMNNPVDTACGDPAETITISTMLGPELPDGPNVPVPPPPPKPKPKPKPRPPAPKPPTFTG